MGIEPTEFEVLFSPCDEDGEALVEPIETLEVNVSAVHDVDRAGLGNELIQDIYVVDSGMRNLYKNRDIAPKVQ